MAMKLVAKTAMPTTVTTKMKRRQPQRIWDGTRMQVTSYRLRVALTTVMKPMKKGQEKKRGLLYVVDDASLSNKTTMRKDQRVGKDDKLSSPRCCTHPKTRDDDWGAKRATKRFDATFRLASVPGLWMQSKRSQYARAQRKKEASGSHAKPDLSHDKTFHEVNREGTNDRRDDGAL